MTDTVMTSTLVDTRVVDCGNHLEQLKKLPDRCLDLVYIDPTSDSNRSHNGPWDGFKKMVAFADCPESTQAYREFMRPRCVELARLLKPTGSFYFHCDWDAKHYIEALLDEVLGHDNFINEFRWKRQPDPQDAMHSSNRLGRVHDTLLLYSGDSKCYFEHLYRPNDKDYVDKLYGNVEHETGRRYRLEELVSQGAAAPANRKPQYEFLGVMGCWRFSQHDLQALYEQGRIHQAEPGAVPRFKRYLDEIAGVPVGSAWEGIQPLRSQSEVRFADLSQEPLKLLEKIVVIALKANDTDPAARGGYSTAVVAALDPRRQWIGMGHFTNALPIHGESPDDAASIAPDSPQPLPRIA